MIEKIKCSKCGVVREWNGWKCLTICHCLKDKENNWTKEDLENE